MVNKWTWSVRQLLMSLSIASASVGLVWGILAMVRGEDWIHTGFRFFTAKVRGFPSPGEKVGWANRVLPVDSAVRSRVIISICSGLSQGI